jgi:hypothetical protein
MKKPTHAASANRASLLVAVGVAVAALLWMSTGHLESHGEVEDTWIEQALNSSHWVPWGQPPPPNGFLEAILGGKMNQNEFMLEYYEKELLVMRDSPVLTEINLSLQSNLQQLVADRAFRFTMVAQDGTVKPLIDMAESHSQEPEALLKALLQLKTGMPSIVLNALQDKATNELTNFAEKLEALLGVYPSFNAYVSPPDTRALVSDLPSPVHTNHNQLLSLSRTHIGTSAKTSLWYNLMVRRRGFAVARVSWGLRN